MPVNIGPKIGIDGEAEFRKELNNIIQQCRTLDSEMKAVTSAFDDNDDSQEKLARQSEVLAKQIQAQTQRVEMLKKGLSESTKEYGEADTKTLKWAQAVNEANTLLNRMSNELETLNTSDFESEMRDAADATEDMNESMLSMGDIVGGNLIADGLGRLVDSLSAAVEETKEYRKIMASLEVSSEQAGYSVSQTAETYKQLYGVLADDQTAATTTANLQALGLAQSDLNTITDATIGAWARYGDSIPIDSLSEAINETIKTGTVTGTFADVLNWAGTSEDEFNKSLQKTNNTTERANLVLQELARQGLDKAGKGWKENNKSLVEANEATADQQEALAELAEVAEPVLTEITELATKFINFIVDNKEVVITAIAGIGAGFVAWKVTEIINGATTAMQAFNAAIKANPVGLIVTAAAAATGVIAAVVTQLGDVKTETDEIIDSATEAKKKLEEAGTALENSTKGLDSALDDVEAHAAVASQLGDELKTLADDTSRTAGEQKRMEMIVSELNQMFPEMGLAIDDTTGSLNMSADAIDKYIKNAENMAKIEAAQKAQKEAVEDLTDAEVERMNVEIESEEVSNKLEEIERKRTEANKATQTQMEEAQKAQEAYNEAMRNGSENANELYEKTLNQSEAMIEYNGQMMTVSNALAQMDTDEQNLLTTQESLKTSMAEWDEKIAGSQEEISNYSTYVEKLTEDNYGLSGSVVSQIDAFNQMNASMQEDVIQITESITSMRDTVTGAIQSQMDIFSQFTQATTVSKDTVLANMQSQVDGFNKWGEDLALLAESTKTTTDGMTVQIDQGLLQYLANMGPEGAGYIAAFNQMTGDELKKANELWAESIDIQSLSTQWGEDLTTAVGQLAAGSEQAWNDVAQKLQVQANEAGEYTGQGFIDAIRNITTAAESQTSEFGNTMIQALNEALGVASPSKKTYQSGKYTVQGFTKAIQDNESLAKRVTKELADAATSTIQDINTSKWRSSGYYAAIGFANGIRSGRSEVISAAAAVAQAAIIAAENTLEIGSPSKVFKEIGAFTSEGFAIGFDIDGLKKQIASALDFQQRNISNITAAQMKYDPVSRAIKSAPAGNIEVHIVVNAAEGQDENEIANRVMHKIQHAVSQKKAVWGT